MAKVAKISEASLARDIKRLIELNALRKATTKEEDALKEKFRKAAGGKDFVFSGPAGDVLVTQESCTKLDQDALRVHLGKKFETFQYQAPSEKVTVRPKVKA